METTKEGREHFANEAIIEIEDTKFDVSYYERQKLSIAAYRLFGKHTSSADMRDTRMSAIFPERDEYGKPLCDAVAHAHKIAKKLMIAVGYTFNYRVERLS